MDSVTGKTDSFSHETLTSVVNKNRPCEKKNTKRKPTQFLYLPIITIV